ncbi:MAG TPA: 4-alpha-glucanotransferase [Candidatus Dormibacteraeota bacterium]|nr:4-alpha-glucanotransferase [Candidatus Dormibacteraeota bacterium]
MRLPRASGLLLHPTSLPAPHGIGDLGPGALRFIDFLAAARQRWWQVLPLGPTSVGNSPYQSPSTFAGNPLLISLDGLIADGLLGADEAASAARDSARVDYGAVIARKRPLLHLAARRLCEGGATELAAACARFRADEAGWLDDFALYMALKDVRGGTTWRAWEPDVVQRRPSALVRRRAQLRGAIDEHAALQFLFFRQWTAVRAHAAARGISILGDLPIFVADDSADVWAHRELFQLDAAGIPTAVAGVPPDYFSATGQLWGNPLYAWEVHEARGFDWWIARLRAALRCCDVVRVDHFIGFTRYWAIPVGETTAVNGAYRPAPGEAVLDAVRAALGDVAIVAEDLGAVTPEVDALRERFALPGMHVLQFAFGGDASNRDLPHRYERNSVVYTGTHDNDTAAGWFHAAAPAVRHAALRYLGRRSSQDVVAHLIRLAMASVADTAIVPVQDVLGLGSAARMNTPGQTEGNWAWRLGDDQLGSEQADWLAGLAATYGRDD